jgi:hypothetical protein
MLHANKILSNFEYKYIKNNIKVYVLTRPLPSALQLKDHGHFRTKLLYSAPFKSSRNHDISNAVIGFTCPHLCGVAHEAECAPKDAPFEFEMLHLQQLCKTMRLPLIVLLNSSCDLRDRVEHFQVSYTGINNTHIDGLYMSPFMNNEHE